MPPLFALAAIGIIAGCSKPESAHWVLNGFFDPTQVGQFNHEKRNEIRGALSILEEPVGIQNTEEPNAADLEPDYSDQHLAPGDVITVSILELLNPGEAMNQQIRIGTSGFETLPVVGRVRMAGLTTRELELEIKDMLRRAQVLEDAEVQVTLVETRQMQFSIIGSVQRAGTYNLPTPEYRLLNALAEAGGVPPQIERVYIFRRGKVEEGATTAPPSPEPAPSSMTFTLSDVSSRPASAPSSGPSIRNPSSVPTISLPSPAGSAMQSSRPSMPVDEMKILEGAPSEQTPSIRWDAEKGEWIVEQPSSRPSAPGALARLARTTSRAATEPGRFPGESAATSATRIIEIPIKDLLDGDPRYNVVIRPFDLINVPPGNYGEYFLMGNVARPGAFELTGRRLTVKEAIASGGGFGPLAWPSRADLIRRVGKDEEQMIQLDLDGIFAGNAPDFYLKPNDIVNVGTNAVAPFLAVLRNAFRLSYGFGFVYDRNFADSEGFQAKEQIRQRRFQERQAQGLPLFF
jgi:polysaccharide export outer membrane protein